MRRLLVACAFLFLSTAVIEAQELKVITFKGKKLHVEMASTPYTRGKGLMYRQSLPGDQGMLFVFDDEKTRGFWMKNTYISLSLGFFNKQKKLLEVIDLPAELPGMPPATYQSKHSATYVLEVNEGWFKKNNVSIGDQFEFEDRKQDVRPSQKIR